MLSAELIFEADSLDSAPETSKEILAEVLNFLTYTTNRKFSHKALVRIVDWTLGLTERDALIFQEKKMWDVAEPALDGAFIDTAKYLLTVKAGEEQQSAMCWYRLGIQEENLEEQFSYFWFALEIVAETLKGSTKVASKCSKHNEPLFCQKCNDYPMHKPFAREAINDIVKQVHPEPSIQSGVSLSGGFIVVKTHYPKRAKHTQELLEAWFVLRAKERFKARLKAALERFPDPALVTPKGMIVRSLESRWGSMTAAGNLVLNWRLIHASTQCIDYVITHELCHLIHANHGKEFWNLLARIFPEWEKHKNKLESDLC